MEQRDRLSSDPSPTFGNRTLSSSGILLAEAFIFSRYIIPMNTIVKKKTIIYQPLICGYCHLSNYPQPVEQDLNYCHLLH